VPLHHALSLTLGSALSANTSTSSRLTCSPYVAPMLSSVLAPTVVLTSAVAFDEPADAFLHDRATPALWIE